MKQIRSLRYDQGILYLIDQRKLPGKFCEFSCTTVEDVEFAIKNMVVRGAPAIGATAAFGVVLAAKEFMKLPLPDMIRQIETANEKLIRTRPTAVNLMWAIKRMKLLLSSENTSEKLFKKLEKAAISIMQEDIKINKIMGEIGNKVIPAKANILTHCNTGALATVGWGTALGVVRTAVQSGKNVFVYADETRPRLQGARLTAWELVQENIPHCLIVDSAAATLIRDKKIDLILVGADRIAKNGDTANKIGTFMLSVLSKVYHIPFYIVAPTSTIDFSISDGSKIEIEERNENEIRAIEDKAIAPSEAKIFNPAFDITPYENITGIITEKKIVYPPFQENLSDLQTEIQKKN